MPPKRGKSEAYQHAQKLIQREQTERLPLKRPKRQRNRAQSDRRSSNPSPHSHSTFSPTSALFSTDLRSSRSREQQNHYALSSTLDHRSSSGNERELLLDCRISNADSTKLVMRHWFGEGIVRSVCRFMPSRSATVLAYPY